MITINDEFTCPHIDLKLGGGRCHAYLDGSIVGEWARCVNGHIAKAEDWIALPKFIVGFAPAGLTYWDEGTVRLPDALFVLGEYDVGEDALTAYMRAARPFKYDAPGSLILIKYTGEHEWGYRPISEQIV